MRVLIIIPAISLFFTCGKPEVKITPIPEEIKALFAPAKKGSYYIFEDSVSKKLDSVYVSSYSEGEDHTQYCKNNVIPQYIDITYKSTLNNDRYTWNVAIKTDCFDSLNQISFYRNVGGTPTLFYTKQKGFYNMNGAFQHDTIIIHKYNSFSVAGNLYTNVYYLISGYYNFYWAENIGIIKFYEWDGSPEVWELKRKHIVK